MRPLAALLHRLRRFGAPPGRPAETLSVPVSPMEGAAAELAPVFAALDGLAAEADERRTRGHREAEVILAAARADAVRVRTAGERAAEQTRAAILAAAAAAADAEAAAIHADALAEAERIRARAAARTPGIVGLLLTEIEAAAR